MTSTSHLVDHTPRQKHPKITEFTPPPKWLLKRSLWLQEQYFSPRYFGAEHINPSVPMMYVGNHTLFATADTPLIINYLYQEHDLFIRGLGDHMNFEAPIWRTMAERFGLVEGIPEYVEALLDSGQSVLLFPGGAREVCKRKGEQNTTQWKERTGFARIAMKMGAPILPFASVGPDEMADILFDAEDFKRSALGKRLLKNPRINQRLRGGDVFMPITRGLGLLPLPKPVRFYIGFGQPIDTRAYQADWQDKDAQWEVRRKVEGAVNELIQELLVIREQDTLGPIRRRLAR